MSDLAEFLLARIAEDEAAARTATAGPWRVNSESNGRLDPYLTVVAVDEGVLDAGGEYCGDLWLAADETDLTHIARWDPARVLAECEAKRRIVEDATQGGDCQGHPGSYQPHGEYGPGYCRDFSGNQYLRFLALTYADHPDYRKEWRV